MNVLLSFAQFEREIIGERIRDKKLATARQGKYIGGQPVLGLDIVDRRYVVNRDEVKVVRRIFELLLELQSCRKVAEALNADLLIYGVMQQEDGDRWSIEPAIYLGDRAVQQVSELGGDHALGKPIGGVWMESGEPGKAR